jgi:hypothetical protein
MYSIETQREVKTFKHKLYSISRLELFNELKLHAYVCRK